MLFLRNKHSEFMVPQAGLEPARRCQQGILSPWCLPIPPLRHVCYLNVCLSRLHTYNNILSSKSQGFMRVFACTK